jgi:hypothetical protein
MRAYEILKRWSDISIFQGSRFCNTAVPPHFCGGCRPTPKVHVCFLTSWLATPLNAANGREEKISYVQYKLFTIKWK